MPCKVALHAHFVPVDGVVRVALAPEPNHLTIWEDGHELMDAVRRTLQRDAHLLLNFQKNPPADLYFPRQHLLIFDISNFLLALLIEQ